MPLESFIEFNRSFILADITFILTLQNWFHQITNISLTDSLTLQVMVVASGAVITKRHTEYAVMGLLGVVVIQGFGYGLIFDLPFFLRNLSVIGGLFMVFSDTMINRRKPFAGLPSISETDRKK